MTISLLIALPVALLIYLLFVFHGATAIRRRHPSWTSQRFVAGAFFAGPILILIAGLAVHWLCAAQGAGAGGARQAPGDLSFLTITALAVLAATPAAAIGYIIARRFFARDDEQSD